ncbi:CAAX amino terminal protease self- immunity [Phocoenobacter uteri]|uniref:CAAX amino terminal protease self- immunity n=1 Tax=Phocoenobacter uteri TaxID=146806 RepID=A0A379C8C6_9PAST|nr:CPBP family intramembrane glutamic endopeptidase [Phocoenobacter uteri]MDG6882403.1 hypothetical protein [Phocoenobacter uteri]SUB58560.1 CAAX amino terminal protease self- immunity [Phocoenobacter uteri]
MKNISLQKVGYITALTYTVLIGVGMYTSFYINGISYEDPKMVETLWGFEIIMTALVIGAAIRFFSWKDLGFTALNTKQLLWLVPMFIVILLMGFDIVEFVMNHDISSEKWSLFALIGFTTFLVGFSEELLYRGIILGAFIKQNRLIAGVFTSAIIFSLLHSMNILGGLTFSAMVIQLLMTFIAGLFFALLRIKAVSIIPLMIFHWLWDFFLIAGGLLGVGKQTSLYFVAFEILFVIIMLPLLIFNNKSFIK